jgi:beta-barrel assembly-enhancing protease
MKRAFVPVAAAILFGASGLLDAQFNIPGLPSFNPFHSPAPASPNDGSVKGVGEMIKGASGISLKDEMKIGGAVAVEIVARNGGVLRDDAITHRVAIIGKSLSAYCTRPELNFRFAVLNSSHINAYSAPGGYVFITKGLYDVLPDDQQLAAVLAHEISHITKRHALKVISRGEFMKGLFDTGGSVSSIPAFDSGVASITDSLFTKGFDPSAEFEADHEGRSLATKVGYEHDALLDFLQDLHKSEGDSKEAFPTHPPLSHRIARLEEK